ncbi:MAG: sulfurtransferase TusA family protein [Wenzhouxiangella sp.]
MTNRSKETLARADALLDVSGHECPVPALETKRRLDDMAPGQILEVIATDPLAAVDLQILCDRAGHTLMASRESGAESRFWIQVSAKRQPGAD